MHAPDAELYADTGQREKAFETLNRAEGMVQEMGMDYWQRRTQEVLERVEGWICEYHTDIMRNVPRILTANS